MPNHKRPERCTQTPEEERLEQEYVRKITEEREDMVITLGNVSMRGKERVFLLAGLRFQDPQGEIYGISIKSSIPKKLVKAGIVTRSVYIVNAHVSPVELARFLGINLQIEEELNSFERAYYENNYRDGKGHFRINITVNNTDYKILQFRSFHDSHDESVSKLHGLFDAVYTFLSEDTTDDSIIAFTCKQGQNRSVTLYCSYLINKGIFDKDYFNLDKAALDKLAKTNSAIALLRDRSNIVIHPSYGVHAPDNQQFRKALLQYTPALDALALASGFRVNLPLTALRDSARASAPAPEQRVSYYEDSESRASSTLEHRIN